MQSGSYFTMGVTHLVCEDYARCGQLRIPSSQLRDGFAMISDGCSNGGRPIDADWGSRHLILAAQEKLIEGLTGRQLAEESIALASKHIEPIAQLRSDCLAATLGIVYSRENMFHFLLAGDGVYGGKRRDGSFDIRHIKYLPGGEKKQSAPFYLSYLMRKNGVQQWAAIFGGLCQETRYNGTWDKMECTVGEVREITPEDFLYEAQFPISQFEFGFIGSDGLGDFFTLTQTKTAQEVVLTAVLQKLLDFSDYGLGFVERQCHWMFRYDKPDTFVRLGWRNSDDVSLGVVAFPEKPEEPSDVEVH
jgi:hypothetical protein